MTLEEICRNLKNPLEDDQNLNEIIEMYRRSFYVDPKQRVIKPEGNKIEPYYRHGHYVVMSNFYERGLMRENPIDKTLIDAKDREKFFCNTYNAWIRYMTHLTPDQKNSIRAKYKDLDGLIGLLQKVGKVSSMQEIESLNNNPLMPDKASGLRLCYDQDGTFCYFYSSHLTGGVVAGFDENSKFYICPKKKDIYKFANIFASECLKRGIPYQFKSLNEDNNHRFEHIVIYSNDKYFEEHLKILNDIKQKYPDMVNDCAPIEGRGRITPNIDGWIGFGFDPTNRTMPGERNSFHSLRSTLLYSSMQLTQLDEYKKFASLNQPVVYNGKKCSIQNCLRDQLRYCLMNCLTLPNHKTNSHSSIHTEADHLTPEEKKYVRGQLTDVVNAFSDDELNSCVDAVYRYFVDIHKNGLVNDESRGEGKKLLLDRRIQIPTGAGKNARTVEVGIPLDMLGRAVEWGLFDVFRANDPNFMKQVRNSITGLCGEYHIDPNNFALNDDTMAMLQANSNNASQPSTKGQGGAQPTNQGPSGTQRPVGATQPGPTQQPQKPTAPARPVPHQNPTSTIMSKMGDIQTRIAYLKSLQLYAKTHDDFAQELQGNNGKTIEDLSCAYVISNNQRVNVADLTYKKIEEIIFEIINYPDYQTAENMAKDFEQVLKSVNYMPTYGTLARSITEGEKLLRSPTLDKVTERRILLNKRLLSSGQHVFYEAYAIGQYHKNEGVRKSGGANTSSTYMDHKTVLLKMQEHYNTFEFQPQQPSTSTNYVKMIDPSTLKGSTSKLEMSFNKTGKGGPYVIKGANGQDIDIWTLPAGYVIKKLAQAVVSGDSGEIIKMRDICENMKGHFNPTYNEMASLIMLINDYWGLEKGEDIDRAIEGLRLAAETQFNECLSIAKFNANNEGRAQATYSDMYTTFKNLQAHMDAKKQATQSAQSGPSIT